MPTILVPLKIRAATFLGAASALLFIACWLALPSRNAYGNPWLEELKQDCAFSNGTKARLYLGNGGATTAYWYTVTVETGLFSPERQVAFSYSEPALSEIECRDDRLVISGGEKLVIGASEFADRRNAPIIYWRGNPEVTARTWSVMDSIRLGIATCLVGIAGWLGFRRNGNHPS